MQAKLQADGYRLDGDNPAETISALLASHKRVDEAVRLVSARLKTDKLEDVAPALDALIAARQKAEADFQQAQKAVQTARAGASKSDAELAALRKEAVEQAKEARPVGRGHRAKQPLARPWPT